MRYDVKVKLFSVYGICFIFVVSIYREYPCDSVAMLNLALLHCGCPRVYIRKMATQLLLTLCNRSLMIDDLLLSHTPQVRLIYSRDTARTLGLLPSALFLWFSKSSPWGHFGWSTRKYISELIKCQLGIDNNFLKSILKYGFRFHTKMHVEHVYVILSHIWFGLFLFVATFTIIFPRLKCNTTALKFQLQKKWVWYS